MSHAIEAWLELERAQLPLWVPVALGAGICAWFALPAQSDWLAWVLGWLGIAAGLAVFARGGRFSHALVMGAVLLAAGCLLPWTKAQLFGARPLARSAMVQVQADVEAVEPQKALGVTRLLLAPVNRTDLPVRIRVNMAMDATNPDLVPGDRIALRAWLMPPPSSALPGAYDFAMRAYFGGIGATGRALGPVERIRQGPGGAPLRAQLAAHVATQVPGPEGAIAVALATGDQNGLAEADIEAMRRSGLAHLLSISGLHVSALIGGVMLVIYRLLALSPRLALRFPLILIAAMGGALAGIGYTLLTGAQVPTVRSCVAALLVIMGLAMGREAISLRLVATGAIIVMLFWPEAVIGPSFQMSFAAVTAIVALYEWAPVRGFVSRRDESWPRRLGRMLTGLFLTGLAVEIVLMPIALFHFHRTGLLGAFANLIAIPLTSFVIMPGEALALMLDAIDLGAPAWWVVGWALRSLLALAHFTANQPHAVMHMPSVGAGGFVLTMLGLLWLMIWRTSIRLLGGIAAVGGLLFYVTAPMPDLLVTADGRHIAVATSQGGYALLRPRAGDYVREQLAESAGFEGEFSMLANLANTRCSPDLCVVNLAGRDGRPLQLLATRSHYRLAWRDLVAACAQADIIVADRRLPQACIPRWLKLDGPTLSQMGGAFILLPSRQIIAGHSLRDQHPWIITGRH